MSKFFINIKNLSEFKSIKMYLIDQLLFLVQERLFHVQDGELDMVLGLKI